MKWKKRALSFVIALFLAVNGIPVAYAENDSVNGIDTEVENGSKNGTGTEVESGSNNGTGTEVENGDGIDIEVENDNADNTDTEEENVDRNNSGTEEENVDGIDTGTEEENVDGNDVGTKEENGNGNDTDIEEEYDDGNDTDIEEESNNGNDTDIEESSDENDTDIEEKNGDDNGTDTDVDTILPTITEIDFIPQIPDGAEDAAGMMEEFAIDSSTYGYYFKCNYHVIVNVMDNVPSSGLAEGKYRLVPYQDGEAQEETTGSQKITDGKAELEIPAGFRGRIFVEAFDYAGNSSGEKLAKAEDNNVPFIEIINKADTGYRDAEGNKLYTEGNSFTVTITDFVSGIREFGYQQNAEQNPYARRSIVLDHDGYTMEEDLGDGWMVTGVADNLVTQVAKTFEFTADDNNVTVVFDAMDYSDNQIQNVQSETFTVDGTPPSIKVEFQDDRDTYYKQSRIANITVIERNFDVGLIEIAMENTLGAVPPYVFEEKSKTEHVAVIDFGEGHYTFGLKGRDLGNQPAKIAYEGEYVESFCIDKTKPDVKITHIDGNFQQAVKANFAVSDSISGIAKVEYLWDDGFLLEEGESGYTTDFVEFNAYEDDRPEHEIILPWNLAKPVPGNRHTLHLRVTDKAGNVYDDAEPVTDPIGSDLLPPQIESIEIRKVQNDESFLEFFSFDISDKDTVEIAVKANDNEANEEFYASGVKSVQINGKEAVQSREANEYVLAVHPDEITAAIRIRVEDNVGLSLEAAAVDIPECGVLKGDDLIIEKDAPTIDFGGVLSHAHPDNKGRMWFGAADGEALMEIKAADCHSGLYSVAIKDNGETVYSKSDFSFKTEEHAKTFRIGDLNDGEHIFTVEVKDNCGNIANGSITFYKDTNLPEKGTITVISPESVNIGGQQWFDKEEVVKFRVDTADDASGVKNISLDINGKSFQFTHDQIKYDETGCHVSVETTGIEADKEHKYTITGTVTDFALNLWELEPLVVYKDFESPTIKKFTVQKKSSALDKVLKVLTFGIYTNDTLIFKAYTKETAFDSGIDYATVQYKGLEEPGRMKDEGEGIFSVEIPANDTVFESDIIVEVYDKYGKVSLSCPNISDAEGNSVSKGKLAMIETELPLAAFSLPKSDSIPRDDGQVWYRSNKTIEFTAQDKHSGINNIDLSVNNTEVLEDKKGNALLKAEVAEAADMRKNGEQKYTFDTNYFLSICGEAKNGKYVVAAQTTDNAGNMANHKAAYYIDGISPVIDRIDFIPKTSDGIENTSEFIEKMAYGYYFKENFSVVINVSDAEPSSGLHEVRYRFVPFQDGKKQKETSGSQKIINGKAAFDVPKGFKGQIFVEAFDYVQNSSGEKTTKAYIVDNTAPKIEVTKNADTSCHDAAGNNLYVIANSFTVVVTDTVSGIRQIGYQQSAEQNPYGRKVIDVNPTGYNLNGDLGDGWKVTGVDANLVTQATKTFTFSEDDNDVMLTFDAMDNSMNVTENVQSETFTVDGTPPSIKVEFQDDRDTYYKQSRIANITVTERNFDVGLIEIVMENTLGAVPPYVFEEKSKTEHVAVIDFGEGYYTFALKGRDLGNQPAKIVYEGDHVESFCIDKTKPDVKITHMDGNFQQAVKANFAVSDSISGVAKVEYLWDDGFLLKEGEADYTTDFVEFDDYVDDRSEYEVILPWELAKTVPGNRHTLHLRVTDQAGNVYDDEDPVTDPIGSDLLPPQIESIEIRKTQNDTLESILKFFSFGTFYKNTVEIAVKVNDNETNKEFYASGVKSVKINGKEAAHDEVEDEYVLTVYPDEIMAAICIRVEDNVGLGLEAMATDIPERGMIKSDDLIIEDDAPTIDFGGILSHAHQDNKGRMWFGTADGEAAMEIKVADCQGSLHSGLYSVAIKDNGEMVYTKSNFSFKTEEHAKTFRIGDLNDGEHIFTVEVEDNCGNTASRSLTFYKDTSSPEKGIITAVSPESVNIGGRQWFDKEEVVKFRVDTADDASGVKNISLDINGKSFQFAHGQIESDEAGCYILADTTGIEIDQEHKYTVTGTVTDFALNLRELEPLVVYKDFENPTIKKFTVQKRSSALDKILKVLTFGIYSNDTLIFKAYTKDIAFDSGIDYATVQYEGLSEPSRMKNEGAGVFSAKIPVKDTIFESDIIVKVYDKYGKVSLSCPNISDAKGKAVSKGKLAMIETELPMVSFTLPKSDSIPRNDGQIWYRSNKTIKFAAQDKRSGINNIDLFVNDVEVLEDKKGNALLKTEVAEVADTRNNDKQKYTFDTNYFLSICGEAKNGKYVIAAQTTDHAGNVSNNKAVYYIDEVSPVIDKIDFVPKTSDKMENTSEFIEEMEYGYYFKKDFKVVINVSDAKPSSGLYEVRYRFVPFQDGKKQKEINGSKKITNGKATLDVPKEFKGQIFVEAFDCVRNSSGEKTTKAYIVDNVAPEIEITKNAHTSYHDAAGNNLYVTTNSFTVVVTDTVSGIKQIGYQQSAEQNPYDRKIIDVNPAGHSVNEELGDGWKVTGVDANLVTQATKTFTFPEDDNDVMVTFDAMDYSMNTTENVQSEKFTVDKTAPIINIVFREDDDTDMYYNQNRVADVTVIERNFDENLIKVEIENTFGAVPGYSFTENSNTEHTAVIDFDEGDYMFDMTGMDLGNHPAIVNFSGGNEKMFYVDKTKPVVEENFAEFSNSAENSFNTDQTVSITVTEHNFDPELLNLKIMRKEAGQEHSASGMEDATGIVLGGARWESTGDTHTISFTFDFDGVYRMEMTPTDLATNIADQCSTVIFEIDKTVPVVSMKNDSFVDKDDTEFLDVYPYARKDEAAPTVEFEDLNLSHLEYKLTLYIPDYTASDAVVVRPSVTSGTVDGNKYTLPEFKEDGVYALELVAVDVAGNKSAVNYNTYARMVNQDVLAFVMESNLKEKTGVYSFEYENGEAISKKPSDFQDLNIFVMTKKATATDIVLRDSNGKEIAANAQCTVDDSIYGIGICNYLLRADFFRENFQDDTDVELQLTVKNQGCRIDLGRMHIDNIAPTCVMPDKLDSWQWFYGETDRTFMLSSISELVDEKHCAIYDNGRKIPFVYSSDDNTITFTLAKGWHNVGIVLDDMAGNANNIQEKINLYIGYFWLWVIAVLSVLVIAAIICIVIYSRNRRKQEFD